MIITITQNHRTGRFHPFVWRQAPQPSWEPGTRTVRYKSASHHTEGFTTLEDAQASARGEMTDGFRKHSIPIYLDIDGYEIDSWEEGEIPARVVFGETEASLRERAPAGIVS